jgi:hypothetical protein
VNPICYEIAYVLFYERQPSDGQDKKQCLSIFTDVPGTFRAFAGRPLAVAPRFASKKALSACEF